MTHTNISQPVRIQQKPRALLYLSFYVNHSLCMRIERHVENLLNAHLIDTIWTDLNDITLKILK